MGGIDRLHASALRGAHFDLGHAYMRICACIDLDQTPGARKRHAGVMNFARIVGNAPGAPASASLSGARRRGAIPPMARG